MNKSSKGSILKGNPENRDGIFYYTEVNKDINPTEKEDASDQKKWSEWRKENYTFFKKELKKFPNESILADIGAGQSHFKDIVDRFKKYAVDFYPYEGVNVICNFIDGLPFKDSSVDILMLSNVLEHTRDPYTMLEECNRVLKDGGVILGAVPFLINVHQRPYDFYRYTDINLNYLLDKYNFKSIKIIPVTSMYALFFNISSRFFINLIRCTKFSKNRFVQYAYVFPLRILWLVFRIFFFAALKPIFSKCRGDEDYPLGYNFKALK